MQKNKSKVIILTAVCAVVFVLFITMLVDFILISLSVSPVFSKIISTSHEDSRYETVIEGHGLLYSTIGTKFGAEGLAGYFEGYQFFWGYKKWDSSNDDEVIPLKYYMDDGTVIEVPIDSGVESDNSTTTPKSNDDDDSEIISDDVLSMDEVRKLSDGDISPFDFMKKFPGTTNTEGDVTDYIVALPNDYVVHIAYSGDSVTFMRLEDHQIGEYINLKTQDIDMFLLERN